MDVNDIPQSTPTIDDQNNSQSFTEGGEVMLYEPSTKQPVLEQEILPEIEKTVEKEIPEVEQIPVIKTTQETPPTVTEPITTLNVVDKRTNTIVEHDVVTKDKLSQLADEDENKFLEQVDTAHHAKS